LSAPAKKLRLLAVGWGVAAACAKSRPRPVT